MAMKSIFVSALPMIVLGNYVFLIIIERRSIPVSFSTLYSLISPFFSSP